MTTFDEIPSVKTAVAREAQRRKRVLATFLALLAIPVAIGLYAILNAPSEVDLVAKDVTPIVSKNVEASLTERMDRAIEPRVDEAVARRAMPVIQRTLDQHLDEAVRMRVQPIERELRTFAIEGNPEQRRLMERVRQLEARVALLERRLAALDEYRPERPAPSNTTKRPQP